MAKAFLYVDGLTTERNVDVVTDALASLDGVKSVVIDLTQKKAQISFDPKKVQLERMRWAVRQEGYTSRPRL
ncbi:MAG TPA: heavy-metal-associated domain-containing protein [Capsulimonadaceae bacterium]